MTERYLPQESSASRYASRGRYLRAARAELHRREGQTSCSWEVRLAPCPDLADASTIVRRVLAFWGALGLCTLGCSDDEGRPTDSAADLGSDAVPFSLTSSAFNDGAEIPARYTCDGEDVSPPLAWEGVPEGTQSLALIVDDPDAPDPAAPETIWVHWLLYDIPLNANELAEAVAELPAGTMEGSNDWGAPGYRGPCPPTGRHRYFFRLYALDSELRDLQFPKKDALVEAMRGLVIGKGELMGTYE